MLSRLIFKRPWSLLYFLKSLTIWINFSKFDIRIFWYNEFIFCTYVIKMIMTRLWVIFICLFLFYKINSFSSHAVFKIFIKLFLMLILIKYIITLPGPGIFWSCGIRYDLSGELYRLRPKLFPFYLFI